MKTPTPFELADTLPALDAVTPPSSGRYSYIRPETPTVPAPASQAEAELLKDLKGRKWGAPKGLKVVRKPNED